MGETKDKKPATERSATERATKAAAQKRWRDKKKREHSETVALHESKRNYVENNVEDELSVVLGSGE